MWWGFDVTEESQYPLVTFALFAYNQEKYIGDAVEAALHQDYPHLEILISDDASSDKTWSIIESVVASYKGPHLIRLNRNERNMGIGAHVSLVNRLATGRLVVAAAGDDISVTHRVSMLAHAWQRDGESAGLYHSACTLLDANGAQLGQFSFRRNPSRMEAEEIIKKNASVIGATEAWDKVLFDVFGDLGETTSHEDHVLTLRSVLLRKKITFIEEPLVGYRQSTGVSSSYGQWYIPPAARLNMLANYLSESAQKLSDVAIAPNDHLRVLLEMSNRQYETALRFEQGFPAQFRELVRLVHATDVRFVLRMTIKRIRNVIFDLFFATKVAT